MLRRKQQTLPFSLFSFQDIITSVTGIILLMTLLLTLELVQRHSTATAQADDAPTRDLQQEIANAEKVREELEAQLRQREKELLEAASMSPQQLADLQNNLERELRQLEAEIQRLGQQNASMDVKKNNWKARKFVRADEQEKLDELRSKKEQMQKELELLKDSNRMIYNPSKGSAKAAWLVDISDSTIFVARAGEQSRPLRFEQRNDSSEVKRFLDWATSRSSASEFFVLLVHPSGVVAFYEIREKLRSSGFDFGFDLIGKDVTVIDPERGGSR